MKICHWRFNSLGFCCLLCLPGKWKRLSSEDKIISLRLIFMKTWTILNPFKKSWKQSQVQEACREHMETVPQKALLEGMSPIAIRFGKWTRKTQDAFVFHVPSLLTGWIGRDEKGREAPGRKFKIILTLPLAKTQSFFHKFSWFWFVLILVPLWPQLLVDFDFGLFRCFYMVEDMRLWCIAWVTVSSEAFWTAYFLLMQWFCDFPTSRFYSGMHVLVDPFMSLWSVWGQLCHPRWSGYPKLSVL